MNKKVKFIFDAGYVDLEKQSNVQGYTLGDKADLMEKLRHSTNMIFVHGLITHKQEKRILKKLQNKVKKYLRPLETEF